MKILIASNNAHKLQELREIFAADGAAIEIIAPREIGIHIDPEENADTYAGNALLKARAFAGALHRLPDAPARWVMADDSGLEVDALNGAPGITSARYHRNAPGGDGCAALLREMDGLPDERRAARFQAVIALIGPGGAERLFSGTCEGRIAREKRGRGGFGFDPVFLVADRDCSVTMAELSPEDKHRISHRGIAARQAAAFLNAAARAASG
jgi:XTP/dITP diphosphohydrolase